ncbi:3-phenylpropionate/cinnamic acid dioxygenase subunit beta [Comamonadaceae bacterium G21597-S1]|nr:3-phenylpropionate/cinnamic acid dioxygenase subunit beta [Comamonadaceae bacterium G21597-S1]
MTTETAGLRKPAVVAAPPVVSVDLIVEISQFLYREARLLDQEEYEQWLGLMTEDVHYWMPGIQARHRKDKALRHDLHRMAFFDDDMTGLRRRVTRFMDPTAWAEDPPTRSCHVISNIEIEPTEVEGEYRVYSTFVNCRGRGEAEEFWLCGRRTDVLRRVAPTQLRIASRMIVTTQTVLLAKNLNVFL